MKEYYAIIQDGYCIHGVGETRQGALDDANFYWNEELELSDLSDPYNHFAGDNICVECTEELYDEVMKNGGDRLFDVIDGIAVLSEEL